MSLFGDIMGLINSGRAAGAVSNANIAAEHGVLGATGDAQTAIMNALKEAGVNIPAAGQQAVEGVNAATGAANTTLADLLGGIQGNLNPYMEAGTAGIKALQNYATGPESKFKFNLDDYFNSPAYNFQLEQGQKAITNSTAAQGLNASGAALKELTNYGQGLASTYYNQAFKQALSTFGANQTSTLQNLQALINPGVAANALSAGATERLGGQQATNTLAAGYYGGETGTSLAQFLAKLNLGGASEYGREAMAGAETAGNFAVGAGRARAGGIMNQGAALSSLFGDVMGLATGAGIPGLGKIGSGSTAGSGPLGDIGAWLGIGL